MTRWGKPIKNTRRGNPKYRLDEGEHFTMRSDGGKREWKDLVGNLASRLSDYWFYKVKPSGTPLAEWAASSDPKKDEIVYEWLKQYPNWFGTGEDTPLDDPIVQDALKQAIQIAATRGAANESKRPLKTLMEGFKRFLNENPYVQPTGGKGYVTPQDHTRQAELEDLDATGFLSDDEAGELEGIKADKDKVVTPDNEYMIAMIMKKRIMDQIAEDEQLNRKRSSISGFLAGTIALDLYARFKGSNMDVMMPYLEKHIKNGEKTLGSLPRKHRSGVKEMLKALPDEVYKRFTEF